MKDKDALFALIKSLTKSEKRYFKLSSLLQSGDKVYLKLFDIMATTTHYDETLFLKQLAHTSKAKNFSDTKRYLYQLILKSMQMYNSGATVKMQLDGLISNISFLYKKGLYTQCQKKITQAKQIAEKYENHLFLLELANWQRKLIRIKSFQHITEQDLDILYGNVFDSIDKYKYIMEHEYHSEKILLKVVQKGPTRTPVDIPPLSASVNHKMATMSFLEKFYTYYYYSNYYFAKNEHKKAYQYLQKARTLMEKHPHHIAERQYDFVEVLLNIIISLLNLKKYNEMAIAIQQLKAIEPTSLYIKQQIFYNANNLEVSLCNKTGQFDKGVVLIEEIVNALNQPNIILLNKQDKTTIYYTAACIYLGAGNFTKANKYINQLLNDNETDIRSDCYCFANILQLIVHFEKGNIELLEYRIKSVKNFLIKRKRLYKIEDIILVFLRRNILHIHDKRQLMDAFKKIKDKIVDITKDPLEKKALDYFDFISWIDSKIQNRPFAEVVRKKAREF